MNDIKNSASVTYQMLGKAEDATFELMDSIMTTKNASCLAEFSVVSQKLGATRKSWLAIAFNHLRSHLQRKSLNNPMIAAVFNCFNF